MTRPASATRRSTSATGQDTERGQITPVVARHRGDAVGKNGTADHQAPAGHGGDAGDHDGSRVEPQRAHPDEQQQEDEGRRLEDAASRMMEGELVAPDQRQRRCRRRRRSRHRANARATVRRLASAQRTPELATSASSAGTTQLSSVRYVVAKTEGVQQPARRARCRPAPRAIDLLAFDVVFADGLRQPARRRAADPMLIGGAGASRMSAEARRTTKAPRAEPVGECALAGSRSDVGPISTRHRHPHGPRPWHRPSYLSLCRKGFFRDARRPLNDYLG